jgi:hypothetical protein
MEIKWETRKKIFEEVKNITLDEVKEHSNWLDKDTFLCAGIPWRDGLNELKGLLDKLYDLYPEDGDTSKAAIIYGEYHKDNGEFWYGLLFEDESVEITELVECDYLNNLMLLAANQPILGMGVEGNTVYLQGLSLPIMVNSVYNVEKGEWEPSDVAEMHIGMHEGKPVLLITPSIVSTP